MTQVWDDVGEAERWWNTERPLTRSLDSTEEGLAMKATQCSLDGCEKAAAKRGWCSMHHWRWLTHGTTDLPPRKSRVKPKTPCSLDGCDLDSFARGLCRAHYTRVIRTGEPGAAEVWDRASKACSVENCDKLSRAKGLCFTHRSRLARHGTTDAPTVNRSRKGADITYVGAHARLKAQRGLASAHLCKCGQPAKDWAYDHADLAELRQTSGRDARKPYSADPAHYIPMCRSCHKTFDWAVKKASTP